MQKEERIRKINEYHAAWLAKMRELESQGYRSGGYDFDTDSTAIVKGMGPDSRIVGYLHRDLTVTWKEDYHAAHSE